MKVRFLALSVLIACGAARAQQGVWQPSPGHVQVPIWPGTIPDAQPHSGPETVKIVSAHPVAGRPWTYVNNVSQPTMTVYSPQGENTGIAMVVFPGGGYQVVAIDLEGTEACGWLTAHGITCVLLKYRVPGEGQYPKSGPYPYSPMALEDAQRTMGLVRLNAARWRIDPHKTGENRYPLGKSEDAWIGDPGLALNPNLHPTRRTPPTFLVQAQDDNVDGVDQSLAYYIALNDVHVPTEMHLYAQGGTRSGCGRPSCQLPAGRI